MGVTMHRTTGSVILKLSHGYTTTKIGQDPLVQLADDALSEFSVAAQPGKWMVDMMPFRTFLSSTPPSCAGGYVTDN